MQAMMKYAFGALLLYAVYCLFLFAAQRMMLFPRGLIGTPPKSLPAISGLERIWLKPAFGKVEAWFIPPAHGRSEPAPLVIFAHGNGELIDFWPQELGRFTDWGIGVLLVEYPGYGRSEGSPSQQRILDVFVRAYDTASSRPDVDAGRIVLLGRSVGGGAICALAAQRPSAAMILMSTFTSVRAFASKYLVPGILVLDPFDNLSAVAAYPNPVLIVHGSRDEIIPYRHGRRLHEAARQSRLITYDAGHNDCPPDWEVFWKDVRSFLEDSRILPRG